MAGAGTTRTNKPNLLLYYMHDFGLDAWRRDHAQGIRPEASHWGMHRAGEFGFHIDSTKDRPSPAKSLVNRLTFGLLRLDFDHLRLNYRKLRQADAVWCMSERELVAVLLANFVRPRPVVVTELCYLLDEWPSMNGLRRAVLRWAMRRADLLLAVSEPVAEAIRQIEPAAKLAVYRFGVPTEALAAAVTAALKPEPTAELRLLMPGNDQRRDWQTAAAAMRSTKGVRLTMLTKHVAVQAYRSDNIDYAQGRDLRDLIEHYSRTDAVLIASLPNCHGAGLTMLLEAAALGLPLIVADDPTLKSYLDERHALIVPPQDSDALADAIIELRDNPIAAQERAERARAHIQSHAMTSIAASERRAQAIMAKIAAN